MTTDKRDAQVERAVLSVHSPQFPLRGPIDLGRWRFPMGRVKES